MSKQKKEVNNTRFYEIFGVPKTATAEEIRKAYRKLVIKMHPDKGGDPAKFQEMQNAYEILSDSQKREIYDNYGEEGIKEGMGNGGADFDPFSFFGGGFGGGQTTKRKCKGKLVQMHISLEDSYNGTKKTLEFKRRIICPKCQGTGSADPDAKTTCSGCKGKGVKVVVQRMGNMVLQSQQTCPDCQGEGKIIKEKCKECKGEKVTHVNKQINIDIDKGVPDGHRYTMKEEGDQYPEIETGDLVIEIYLDKHKDFIRKGADLVYKCEISLLQALTGFKVVITHLDGRKILVSTSPNEIIIPQQLKTVKELGMPFFNSPYKFGHLYLDFQIDFPETLTPEQKKKVSEILKNEKLNKIEQHPKDMEKYFMTEYKVNEENSNYHGGRKEEKEDDEDEDGGYHKTVNCANQ